MSIAAPYAGTSGHQGDASQDAEPARSVRQSEIYRHVLRLGHHGATSKEVEMHLDLGHGVVSSALSCLHRDGFLVKLKQRRHRYGIYISPTFVQQRQTVPHHSNKRYSSIEDPLREVVVQMLEDLDTGRPKSDRLHDQTCWKAHAICALEHALELAG